MLTPQHIADYLRDHPAATTAEIARHFVKSDRYIRKLKAQLTPAPSSPSTTRARLRVVPPPRSCRPVTSPPASMFQRVDAMIKCPACGELMHPIPGVDTPETWKDGCYLCRSQPANDLQEIETPASAEPEPVPPADDQPLIAGPELELGTTAPADAHSAVPALEQQPEQPAVPVQSTVTETQTVRTIVRTIYIQPGVLFWVAHVPAPVLLGLVMGLIITIWAFAGVR
jgi:hypothetical protein